MKIPMKGKKDWTQEEWLAYKTEAQGWIKFMHAACLQSINRAVAGDE